MLSAFLKNYVYTLQLAGYTVSFYCIRSMIDFQNLRVTCTAACRIMDIAAR